MSMMVSFCAVLFPDVLGRILNLLESVSGGFPTYSSILPESKLQIKFNAQARQPRDQQEQS